MPFLKQLNPAQRAAVKAIDGPVMIIAGAGSGKTRVLTYRIAYLLQCGVPPQNILALTFTNKAANEMKERIISLVGDDAQKLWMGTFHSVFARLLRVDGKHLGFTSAFTIYDTDDSQTLIRSILQDQGLNAQQIAPAAVRSRISAAKNQMHSPESYNQQAVDFFEQKVSSVFFEYQKRLRSNNAMDFDDLILHPIILFEQEQDVLKKYQKRFKFILVDEYQDTNRAQYKVLNLLASSHRNICVVGDDAQSIYAFRGADIRNILEFEKDYKECHVFRLEQNYRSTKKILLGADSIIKNNIKQIPKTLWTDNKDGELITVIECYDEREEGMKIIHAMQEESRKQKLQLKDFAVLYRTNAQSRAIEDTMRRSGIPYLIIGGIAFYRRKEIKDILAYIRLIVNPLDNESLVRIINVPSRGIGDTSIARLKTFAEENQISLIDAIKRVRDIETLSVPFKIKIESFSNFIRKYIGLRDKISAGELVRSLVDELEIVSMYKKEETPEAISRIENIQELLSAISEFQSHNKENNLEAFLAEVSLIADVDSYDTERNAVTLMTLHSAKGLEFPVVFIAGMEEGLFPSSQARENNEIEEERRLCYVGMTRAMKKLFLLYTHQRMLFGEWQKQIPSRFLEEIDPQVVKSETTRRKRANGQSNHVRAGNSPQSAFGESRTSHREKRSSPQFNEYSQIAEDSYSQIAQIKKGTKVLHTTFGPGVVLSLSGNGEMKKAEVKFDSVGRKTLVLKYADLKIL